MLALEQTRGATKALQTSIVVLLTKTVSKINLETLTILAKRLILDGWLGPGRTSADCYITAIKIQMQLCIDGRQVKTESF